MLFNKFRFSLPQTAHFEKGVDFPWSVFATFRFFNFVFSLHFKQYDNIVSYLYKIFDELLKLLNFWLLLSNHYILNRLFTEANSSWVKFHSAKVLEIKTSMTFNLIFANNTVYHASSFFSYLLTYIFWLLKIFEKCLILLHKS